MAHVRSVLQLGVFAPANVHIAEDAFLDGEAQVWAKMGKGHCSPGARGIDVGRKVEHIGRSLELRVVQC